MPVLAHTLEGLVTFAPLVALAMGLILEIRYSTSTRDAFGLRVLPIQTPRRYIPRHPRRQVPHRTGGTRSASENPIAGSVRVPAPTLSGTLALPCIVTPCHSLGSDVPGCQAESRHIVACLEVGPRGIAWHVGCEVG